MQQLEQTAMKLFSSSQILFGKQAIGNPHLKTNSWLESGVLAFSKPQSQVQRLGAMMQLLRQKNTIGNHMDVENEEDDEELRYEPYEEYLQEGNYPYEQEGNDEEEDGWVTEEQEEQQDKKMIKVTIPNSSNEEGDLETHEQGYESQTIPMLHSKIV